MVLILQSHKLYNKEYPRTLTNRNGYWKKNCFHNKMNKGSREKKKSKRK